MGSTFDLAGMTAQDGGGSINLARTDAVCSRENEPLFSIPSPVIAIPAFHLPLNP
jgi:hypothetical protein